MEENERDDRDEVYSHPVRAGKRTYFFDVKATRNNDYYLTITESKKRFEENGTGQVSFEKHKIFLYKEDFEKFCEGLQDAISYTKAALAGEAPKGSSSSPASDFDKVDFDSI